MEVYMIIRHLGFANATAQVVVGAFARRSRAEDTKAQFDSLEDSDAMRRARGFLGVESVSHEIIALEVEE